MGDLLFLFFLLFLRRSTNATGRAPTPENLFSAEFSFQIGDIIGAIGPRVFQTALDLEGKPGPLPWATTSSVTPT